MATISVGILGLGRLGTSFGLALKRYSARKDARQQFSITGYDTTDNANVAKTKNAVDTITRSIVDAAADKDIVILSLPYRDVAAAYRAIGQDVRPGTVVLDVSPLKLPSQLWSEKHLRPDAYALGITPILNPAYLFDGLDDAEHAAADLFERGTMLLMPHPKCAKEAVELAADFAELLGGTTHFADPAEHDVWVAATEGIPAALGVAAFYSLQRSDGWNDAQRAGNPAFGRMTRHLYDTHPDDLRDMLLHNRENVVRQIDSTIETLRIVRDVLAQNDQKALEGLLIDAAQVYGQWVGRRQRGEWDDRDLQVKRESGGELLMTGLFGNKLSKRLRREKDDE